MITPILQPGDWVAITAPASRVSNQDIAYGVEQVKAWGLQVKIGATVGQAYHNFSDTLENRIHEFQTFLNDDSIRCIMAARGGYGVSDILDQLDWTAFMKKPKWIVGFSDITALLMHVVNKGVECVHGPMAKTLTFDSHSNRQLEMVLMGEDSRYSWDSVHYNRAGVGQGQAIGGNLVLLSHIIGSASDVDYAGKILFIEDIGEKFYNIDRILVQLKRSGKLSQLAGLVVGDFSDMLPGDPAFGKNIEEIVLTHTQGTNYPIAFGFPFGHEDMNLPIVMGRNYKLEVNAQQVALISNKNAIV